MNSLKHLSNNFISLLLLTLFLVLSSAKPTWAITHGTPDGTLHPQVVLLAFDIGGEYTYRCTGTFLSPTVILTAGHCTFNDPPVSGGRIYTDPTPPAGYPTAGGIPFDGANVFTHPDFNPNFFVINDVGIITIDAPGYQLPVGTDYGLLPPIGLLNELATNRGLQDQTFTVVGYGFQAVKPDEIEIIERFLATTKLISVNGVRIQGIPEGNSVAFTNHPGNDLGGTCGGDSGGPVFQGTSTTIAAVNSFGKNPNCTGYDAAYRIDTTVAQDFINSFLP